MGKRKLNQDDSSEFVASKKTKHCLARPKRSDILTCLNGESKMTGLLQDLNAIIANYARYELVQFNFFGTPTSIVCFNNFDDTKSEVPTLKKTPHIFGMKTLSDFCNEWKIKITVPSLAERNPNGLNLDVQIGIVCMKGILKPSVTCIGIKFTTYFHTHDLIKQSYLKASLHNSIITCRVNPDRQCIYFYVNDYFMGQTRRFARETLRHLCPMITCWAYPFPMTFEVISEK